MSKNDKTMVRVDFFIGDTVAAANDLIDQPTEYTIYSDEWVQLTYTTIRLSPDGETLATFKEDDDYGFWHISGMKFSDVVISAEPFEDGKLFVGRMKRRNGLPFPAGDRILESGVMEWGGIMVWMDGVIDAVPDAHNAGIREARTCK